MASLTLLVLGLVIGLVGVSQSEILVPFPDAIQRTIETLLPCGTRCIAEKYDHLLAAYDHCVMSDTGIIPRVTRYLIHNHLVIGDNMNHVWPAGYDALFKQPNPMCGWFREYRRCFENYFGHICGLKVRTELQKILMDIETFACSVPSYIGCTVDPALFTENGPYSRCLQQDLFTTHGDYTDPLYGNSILNQETFLRLHDFGQCIGDAITSNNQICHPVGASVSTYIRETINYFDFGVPGGKDYLKCFANPTLISPLTTCGTQFFGELLILYSAKSANPKSLSDPEFEDDVLQYINTTVFYRRTMVLARPFNVLSSCLKNAIGDVCQNEPESVSLVNRILLPLDQYFNDNVRDDIEQLCPGLVGSHGIGAFDDGRVGDTGNSATMEVTLIALCAGFAVIMALNYRIINLLLNPLWTAFLLKVHIS